MSRRLIGPASHPAALESDARGPAKRWWTPSAGPFAVAPTEDPCRARRVSTASPFGAVQAMKEIYPEITVLQLDAHADPPMPIGTPYSHALARHHWNLPPHPGGHKEFGSVEGAEFRGGSRPGHSADFILDGGAWWRRFAT